MNTPDADRICELVVSALERTAFVIADAMDAHDAADYGTPGFFSRIRYRGPACGWITLAANEDFVRELASSLLGVEPDEIDPAVEGCDALKEFANITGGSVILELGGDDCPFSLDLPESIDAALAESSADGGVTCWLDAEGSLLRVTWTADPAPASAAA